MSLAENGTRDCKRISKPNKNGSFDIGVFQINASAHAKKATIKQLQDCKFNIDLAKQIYDSSNWHPWTVYKSKSYLAFLNK